MEKENGKNEVEELLNSELEQVEGGACQCDSYAAQVVQLPTQNNSSGSTLREA